MLALETARRILPDLQLARGTRCDRSAVALLPTVQLTADATSKVVIRNQREQPEAIFICSSPLAPDTVARAVAAAAWAEAILPAQTAQAILSPLASGYAEGLSYAVYPWCLPLSDHRLVWPLQRRRLRPRLLRWLREVVKATLRDPLPSETEVSFLVPLQHLAQSADLGDMIRGAAEHALRRLQQGKWRPRHVLAHNDLWKGNILYRQPKSLDQFVVIDWTDATETGQAFYDLVRLADSMQLNRVTLASEVREHCRLLACEPLDARGYLLAALGNIEMRSASFTRQRFLRLVNDCCRKLLPALER
jgi:Phosphotransferase enzyme family